MSVLEIPMADPRICPGMVDRPDLPPDVEPTHQWYVSSGTRCSLCGISQEELRDRVRDWRYEILAARNADVVERLAEAIERQTLELRNIALSIAESNL